MVARERVVAGCDRVEDLDPAARREQLRGEVDARAGPRPSGRAHSDPPIARGRKRRFATGQRRPGREPVPERDPEERERDAAEQEPDDERRRTARRAAPPRRRSSRRAATIAGRRSARRRGRRAHDPPAAAAGVTGSVRRYDSHGVARPAAMPTPNWKNATVSSAVAAKPARRRSGSPRSRCRPKSRSAIAEKPERRNPVGGKPQQLPGLDPRVSERPVSSAVAGERHEGVLEARRDDLELAKRDARAHEGRDEAVGVLDPDHVTPVARVGLRRPRRAAAVAGRGTRRASRLRARRISGTVPSSATRPRAGATTRLAISSASPSCWVVRSTAPPSSAKPATSRSSVAPRGGVHPGGRLVEEEGLRSPDEGERDREATALAAREPGRVAVGERAEVEPVERTARRDGVGIVRPHEVDRLAHAEPGREPDLLQDRADPPSARRRLARVEPEEVRASRVEPAEAEQDRHGGRLAGAVRAEQRRGSRRGGARGRRRRAPRRRRRSGKHPRDRRRRMRLAWASGRTSGRASPRSRC